MSSNELKVEQPKQDGSASPRSLAKLYRTQKELLVPEVANLSAKLPEWCRGQYIRTGPGKFDFDKSKFQVNHFMDGYAIITKFEIGTDQVKFTKKFLETDAYKKAMMAQKPVICEYGTQAQAPDPTKSRFARFIPTSLLPEMSDNSNINLFTVGDNICVTGETCYFRELDADDMSSGEKIDTNKMFGLQNASAHPLTDDDGCTYNVGSSLSFKYNIFKIPPSDGNSKNIRDTMKKSKIISSVPTSHTGYLSFNHSFGMSKNYFVIIEQPFVLNVSKILGALMSKGYSFSDWLEWRPELGNRFHIVEKVTGKILKTEIISSEPFFFLHVINCFELNNQIILDLTTFPDPTVLNALDMNKLRKGEIDNDGKSVAQRFVLPIVDVKDVREGINICNFTGSTMKCDAKSIREGNKIICTGDTMTEKGLELPVINRRFLSKKTSYFYATGSVTKGFFENSLCKVHATTKQTFLFKESDSHYFGEPTFIPNPEATTEDDGILITAVTDVNEGSKDFLVFVKAKNMEELARAEFENEIPQALHGIFVPANDNKTNGGKK